MYIHIVFKVLCNFIKCRQK